MKFELYFCTFCGVVFYLNSDYQIRDCQFCSSTLNKIEIDEFE